MSIRDDESINEYIARLKVEGKTEPKYAAVSWAPFVIAGLAAITTYARGNSEFEWLLVLNLFLATSVIDIVRSACQRVADIVRSNNK